MSFCKEFSVNTNNNSTKNSFSSVPPPLEDHYFSQAFHQILGSPSPPQTPPSFPPNNLTLNSTQQIPNMPLHPTTGSPPLSAVETTGNRRTFSPISLMWCTESLGFESSDEMMSSSFKDMGKSNIGNYYSENHNSCRSSSLTSSTSCCLRKQWEEKKFPPPLTSLSENGRRNFVLKSMRKDGRLEITGVMSQRPEIFCATRDNGRLRLNLVSLCDDDEDENDYDDDGNYEDDNDGVDEKEEREKEDKWKINSGGSQKRCYQREMHVWGPQVHHHIHNHRCVMIV